MNATPGAGSHEVPTDQRGNPPLKLCLAASGGGHVRQLLDLKGVWSRFDYFFLTEDTALGRSLQEQHKTYFVPHVAWGQVKRGNPFAIAWRALQSIWGSASIILRERPDVIISTGAGAVYFAVVWARLFGARVIAIESFARFDRPSLFGRLAAPIAHEMIVQSPNVASHYPKAKVFDPFKILTGTAPPKEALLFATVGATLPFERLVNSVAELKRRGVITERVILQTGVKVPEISGVETLETLTFDQVNDIQTRAATVICHGGTGSLITALQKGCRVIAMPRMESRGEHYDNHQEEIVGAFVARGLIASAETVDQLEAAVVQARTQDRVMATTEPAALTEYLSGVLDRLADKRSSGQAR
jgi:UDP-N-acetylglucosamine--N-acetylmuramyl-(pentapeptide) pyrophosphoryl-undecaprenol N-acetylglucosamine transferase